MTNPIEAWRTEHAYFNRLLKILHKQVDAFHCGDKPNYDLMLDIISYLRDYSGHMHHPREDVAFARMARQCPDLKLTLSRLGQEHRIIAQAGESLRKQLDEILAGSILPKAEVEVAAATYLVYYGNHIDREEEEVLPRAAQVLMPADWEAIRDAVPHRQDPLFGIDSDEHYRELRRHIALET